MSTKQAYPQTLTFKCGRCSMVYLEYESLLEHLFWRHGTESTWCNKCSLKRWRYAVHVCNVLPVRCKEMFDEDTDLKLKDTNICSERTTDFCFCGKLIADAPMIGCDGPNCEFEWFHFSCVGISIVPEGDWICPKCINNKK